MASPTPSSNLFATLRSELARWPPFTRMAAGDIDTLLRSAQEAYYAPGEVLVAPDHGPVRQVLLLRRGAVTGRRPGGAGDAVEYEEGEMFPLGAALAERAVSATYSAQADVFALLLPIEAVRTVAERSAVFADFLSRRAWQLLEASQRALQESFNSRTLADSSLEAPLGSLPRRVPVALPPQAPVGEALRLMHERRIGSVLVVDAAGSALGILTRHDVPGRIALPQLPLDTPLAEVMSTPVHSLGVHHSVHDAALLMSRHGLRHVPVTEDGRLVNIVSERDLFSLQRLSLNHLGSALRDAPDTATLAALADDIRRFARNLLAQGLNARALTELISHLNDLLCERLVLLQAATDGLDPARLCWLAFGSEGRGEQTIATDQDNGLVFVSTDPARDRPVWLAFAGRVNAALAACGYPLCPGQVMASNPDCCLAAEEWADRFDHWIAHGAPEDLLKASIFFDLRPIAGQAALAAPLRALVTARAAATLCFQKQLADNALRSRPPLNWHGGIDTATVDGRSVIDLKHAGTALFVDAARLFALARGVPATATRVRLLAAGQAMGVPEAEREAWAVAFDFLQMLRLQVQLQSDAGVALPHPNQVDPARLNHVDRRMLKEALRVAGRLQQRLALDYGR